MTSLFFNPKLLPNSPIELEIIFNDWLRLGGDQIEWEAELSGGQVSLWKAKTKIEGIDNIFIYNANLRGIMTIQLSGITEFMKIVCTQNHNCSKYEHLEYFDPIARETHRNLKREELFGPTKNPI